MTASRSRTMLRCVQSRQTAEPIQDIRTRIYAPARPAELLGASGDRGHQQNFVTFLKGIRRSAEKADVLFIDIDVQKAADLALVIAEVRLEFGELLVEHREEFPEIGCGTCDRRNPGSVAPQGTRNVDGDGHRYAPTASASRAAATTPGTSSTSSVCCRYASNSTSLGAIGRSVLYAPASTSVVLRPFPVTHSTVVSSGRRRS